jgi:transaldolase
MPPPARKGGMNRLARLRDTGVSIWLDTLSRELIEDGGFDELTRNFAVTGATSNPTIFASAICGSDRYDDQLAELIERHVTDPREQFLELALEDVRRAAGRLARVHARSGGDDGFVSFEVTPYVAYDADATVAEALDLWRRLDAPNTMIKVPATGPGLRAIEDLTAAGVNVNVTLLFSVDRYEEVIEAHLRGLERRAAAGRPLGAIRSVASFFISRVDAKADAQLPAGSPWRGRVGIANARSAYRTSRARYGGSRWKRLEALGASPQRPLWASTAPKDRAYPDVLYLEQLALPGTILTVPVPTLRAYAHHGSGMAATDDVETPPANIDLRFIAARLGREGVEAFRDSYDRLLRCVAERAAALSPQVAATA